MSDFLTRLARRAIGAAPVVTPRLPPRFAPLVRLDAGPDRERAGEARRREPPRRPDAGTEDPDA